MLFYQRGSFADITVETDVSIGSLIKEIVMEGSIVIIIGVTTIRQSGRDVLVIRISIFIKKFI